MKHLDRSLIGDFVSEEYDGYLQMISSNDIRIILQSSHQASHGANVESGNNFIELLRKYLLSKN